MESRHGRKAVQLYLCKRFILCEKHSGEDGSAGFLFIHAAKTNTDFLSPESDDKRWHGREHPNTIGAMKKENPR